MFHRSSIPAVVIIILGSNKEPAHFDWIMIDQKVTRVLQDETIQRIIVLY